MLEPRPLTTLWASTVCYRDSVILSTYVVLNKLISLMKMAVSYFNLKLHKMQRKTGDVISLLNSGVITGTVVFSLIAG
jgi:hypothetical protein